ncbi:hypothetical protein NL676_028787 [Syzygium grande]|nr:hypothetical protein NL676_028787 [Syzygium grande]
MDENKNHVEEEEDLSFFDGLNDLEGDEIFSKFMNQSPVHFSELEQYMDDEMSPILKQEIDDSNVVDIPRTSSTPSAIELPADFKKPRKKRLKSTLQESAILNPRRSKRIMLKRASATKSENTKRVEEYLLEEKTKSCRARARARTAEIATLETETKDQSDENNNLEKFHGTMISKMYSNYVGNEDIMSRIRWLQKLIPIPTMGRKHSAEVPRGFAAASSSATGDDGALPRCTTDDNHWPDDSPGNNGLAKGSSKPADLAPTH